MRENKYMYICEYSQSLIRDKRERHEPPSVKYKSNATESILACLLHQ